jgi:MFS family permease
VTPPVAPARLGSSFWRLFASSSTSNLSDGILQAALPLLAATLTRDPVAVSLLSALAFLPWLLFALPAGTLVDRVDRRAAMSGANVLRGVLVGLLAVSVLAGFASLPVLYAVAFLLGCAETVYDSAARAILPTVVDRAQLERGNSLLTTAESVGNIFLGAPVGAWLFAVAVALPLWVNSTAYLVAALLALSVAGQFRPVRETRTSVREDVVEGLRWLRHHELLRPLMATSSAGALVHSMAMGILVLYALEDLGLSERGFGLMLAAAGVGAVIGSLLSPAVTRLLGRTNAMGASQLASAVALVSMAAWQHPVAGTVFFAVSAGAISTFNVQIMSVRQALIPEELFGRVQGAYRTVIWGGIPLGTVVGGAVGAWLGLPAVFLVSGAAGVVIAVVTWAVLHARRDLLAAAFADRPATDLDPQPIGSVRRTPRGPRPR